MPSSNSTFTIVKHKNKYTCYDKNGKVVIITYNKNIIAFHLKQLEKDNYDTKK